jgi:hypothetical protein
MTTGGMLEVLMASSAVRDVRAEGRQKIEETERGWLQIAKKVKLSLEQALKTQRGNRYTALLLL